MQVLRARNLSRCPELNRGPTVYETNAAPEIMGLSAVTTWWSLSVVASFVYQECVPDSGRAIRLG